MFNLSRNDFNTKILAEIADITTKVNQAITTNGVGDITGAILNATLMDIKASMEELHKTVKDSHFNLLTDTTNNITEGSDNSKWFFSEPHFLFRMNAGKTDVLPEGTVNLYYTQARVDARIDALRPTQGSVPPVSGSNTFSVIEEGGGVKTINLVDAQARDAINLIVSKLIAAKIML